MDAKAAVFVSNRLPRPAMALLCLLMAQMLVSQSACHAEPLPMGAVRIQLAP